MRDGGTSITRLSAIEACELIADFLANHFADRDEIAILGPMQDRLSILVVQPGNDLLMVQVNDAEVVIR